MPTCKDRVICVAPGEYEAVVDGKRHGTWRSAAEARGGLQVEQRRAAARKAKAAQEGRPHG